jgi:co-chaperonin GroES (HSP10)
LLTQARADVLFKRGLAVDRGRGDTVGDRIHWISCDGRRSEIKDPPYTVYKRKPDTECEDLRASSRTGSLDELNTSKTEGLDASVFGLKECESSRSVFVIGEVVDKCKVEDQHLARHFLKKVRAGDTVIYRKYGNTITLKHGDDELTVDSSEWHREPKSSGLY